MLVTITANRSGYLAVREMRVPMVSKLMVRKLKLRELTLRELTSVLLILLTPCAVLAADTDTAVLYGTGSVYLNGSQLANSSPVTSGDVIQTKETGAANLNAAGSSIVIQSNTIVRMQSNGLALDRGSVSMATGKGMAVLARDFKITPASGDWTEFYVSRASGVIQIMARKNAITIGCGPNTTTIREGQQLSRDDAANCGLAERAGAGAATAAKAPILNSTWAEIAGLGTGGVIVGLYLSKGDDPLSPSGP